MKKIIIILLTIFSITLYGCNDATTNTINIQSTSPITDDFTTIINDEIYLKLNSGQDTVEINTEWIDSGAKFVLNDEEFDMTTTDNVDVTTLGLYQVSYTYTYQETEYEIIRYVIVLDQTKPAIELNLGVDTIKVGNNWIDAGVTITDNSGETLTAVINGTVDISTPGTYEVTYKATDSSGNESSITRYVNVIE